MSNQRARRRAGAASAVTWPVWSGSAPAITDFFSPRPETGYGLDGEHAHRPDAGRPMMVLAGPGGYGKTYLAAAMLRAAARSGRSDLQVWVNASSPSATVLSYARAAADLGLPVYPGAVPTTGNGNDTSANVNLGFGPWQLRVKVVKYRTTDPRDKVIAFYRKALGQFGTVIACDGNSPVGKPTVTDQGLTCYDNEHHGSVNINIDGKTSDSGFNLRVGSPHHQRIVAFKDNSGKGTKFTIVELVLPSDHSRNNTPD